MVERLSLTRKCRRKKRKVDVFDKGDINQNRLFHDLDCFMPLLLQL